MMYCNTKGCVWEGELTTHKLSTIGSGKYCGLCLRPAQTAPAPPIPEARQVRRDQDAEDQEALAKKAEKEFSS